MNADPHAMAAAPPGRLRRIGLPLLIALAAIVAARILLPVPLPHIQLPAETLVVLPGVEFVSGPKTPVNPYTACTSAGFVAITR